MCKQWIVRFLTAALVTGLLGACSSMRIHADYDPDVQFATLRGYQWMEDKKHLVERWPELTRRVHELVDAELEKKGFSKTPTEKADFLVRYDAAVNTKLNIQRLDEIAGYAPGSWQYSYAPDPWFPPYTRSYEWDEGTLVIDVVERESMHLIWRGVAEAQIGPDVSRAKLQDRVAGAIQKIMKRFPPERNRD